MYLSSLQKFILNKTLKNISLEGLSIDSDAIEKYVSQKISKEPKIDIINSSIDDLLKIKKDKEEKYNKVPIVNYGSIELDSNAHAHIYFFEPVIEYFKIKPKDKFINNENYLYENTSEDRKKFEILKRKYIRKDGNHKRGVIRGECKYLKKAKASLSRSFSTLVKKKLIRKISIIDYENKEIGIGFNLTELGKKTINEKK
ncbi:MAG: hypothetical protein VX499_06315 [Bacteroidota bacterium]|nr:hypothetical protein [Bacteroidota bacterium]